MPGSANLERAACRAGRQHPQTSPSAIGQLNFKTVTYMHEDMPDSEGLDHVGNAAKSASPAIPGEQLPTRKPLAHMP